MQTSKILTAKERAVFVFQKGSQIRNIPNQDSSYNYVRNILNIMMAKNGVDSEIIFIGGHIEDVISYIAGIIDLYYLDSISIDLADDKYSKDSDFEVPSNI